MVTHFFGDTAVLTGRSLKHVTRSLDTIITTAVTPIAMMLLFVYVLGGAITTGSDSYVTYLLPGILLITIASGIAYTAYRLFLDLQSGIFERFHSMPIARSSVLWAHVLTSLVANLISLLVVVLVALLMGFRSGAGVLAWLAVAGILILFTLALTWLAVIVGLTAKTVDGASAFSYPLIFLPFISSAFVPTATMPGPVRWFATTTARPAAGSSPRSRTRCGGWVPTTSTCTSCTAPTPARTSRRRSARSTTSYAPARCSTSATPRSRRARSSRRSGRRGTGCSYDR